MAAGDREKALQALREIAPNFDVARIWGRMDGATPDMAQEGNAWAADPEDVVDLILKAIGRT